MYKIHLYKYFTIIRVVSYLFKGLTVILLLVTFKSTLQYNVRKKVAKLFHHLKNIQVFQLSYKFCNSVVFQKLQIFMFTVEKIYSNKEGKLNPSININS
jgi:hypothetical protein